MSAAPQPIGKRLFLDVAIPLMPLLVAEVGIPQYLLEECEDTFLCACFSVTNRAHVPVSLGLLPPLQQDLQ